VIWFIISRIDDFIEKFFERKLHDLKRNTRWKCGIDLEWSFQNQVKFIIVFLNGNSYFLLHILVAYLESFPKHYNKVTFHWIFSESWSLEVTVLPALSKYACACERDSYARAPPRSIHTAWHTLTRTELSPILPNWTS